MSKEFNLKEVFTMWLKKAEKGGQYLSGKTPDGLRLVGFINVKKKNPKEPDIRIYEVGEDGKAKNEELTSLWVNVSKTEKKYLSGKVGESRVVGFFNAKGEVNGKYPYFSIYYSDDQAKQPAAQTPIVDGVESSSEEVPF